MCTGTLTTGGPLRRFLAAVEELPLLPCGTHLAWCTCTVQTSSTLQPAAAAIFANCMSYNAQMSPTKEGSSVAHLPIFPCIFCSPLKVSPVSPPLSDNGVQLACESRSSQPPPFRSLPPIPWPLLLTAIRGWQRTAWQAPAIVPTVPIANPIHLHFELKLFALT